MKEMSLGGESIKLSPQIFRQQRSLFFGDQMDKSSILHAVDMSVDTL